MSVAIDLIRMDAPEHAALMEEFMPQLIICFLKRMGGKLSMPVSEVDDTSQDMLAFRIDEHRVFHFEIVKKS